MPVPDSVLPSEQTKEIKSITIERIQEVANRFLSDSYNCDKIFRSFECDLCENENCKKSFDDINEIWKNT